MWSAHAIFLSIGNFILITKSVTQSPNLSPHQFYHYTVVNVSHDCVWRTTYLNYLRA